jgi:hypothetical protein
MIVLSMTLSISLRWKDEPTSMQMTMDQLRKMKMATTAVDTLPPEY